MEQIDKIKAIMRKQTKIISAALHKIEYLEGCLKEAEYKLKKIEKMENQLYELNDRLWKVEEHD